MGARHKLARPTKLAKTLRNALERTECVLIEIAQALQPGAHPPTPSRKREGEL